MKDAKLTLQFGEEKVSFDIRYIFQLTFLTVQTIVSNMKALILHLQDNKINWKCEVTNYRRDITQNVCRILISKVESDASRPYITQW